MEQQGVFLTQEPPPSQGAGQEGRARRKVLAQKEREALVKKKMTAPIEAMKAGLHAAVFPRPPALPGSTERKEAAMKALMSLKVGRGDNRAVTELGFAHVTTKTWAYSRVFGFFRKKIRQENCPPPTQITF